MATGSDDFDYRNIFLVPFNPHILTRETLNLNTPPLFLAGSVSQARHIRIDISYHTIFSIKFAQIFFTNHAPLSFDRAFVKYPTKKSSHQTRSIT